MKNAYERFIRPLLFTLDAACRITLEQATSTEDSTQ